MNAGHDAVWRVFGTENRTGTQVPVRWSSHWTVEKADTSWRVRALQKPLDDLDALLDQINDPISHPEILGPT